MRALAPRLSGYATNPVDGVRSHYEVFGPERAERTVLLLPTWSLVHSRIWKMQVPFLARSGYRVVTFDGRGNGLSDLPATGYGPRDYTNDALAVMDACGVERADVVGFSAGARTATYLAGLHPERVATVVYIAPSMAPRAAGKRQIEPFLAEPPDREGWNKYNAVHWREDIEDFVRWFAAQVHPEPHSTKPQDDTLAWSRGTTPEVLVRTVVEGGMPELRELWELVAVPVLFVHGDDDRIIPLANTLELAADLPQAELVVFEGSGHAPQVRDPVRFNLLLSDFLERTAAPPVARNRGEAAAHAGA